MRGCQIFRAQSIQGSAGASPCQRQRLEAELHLVVVQEPATKPCLVEGFAYQMEDAMKLYIETSVPNMLLHEDAPDKKKVSRLFFDWLKLSAHEPFVSPVVTREISKTRSPRRELLEEAVVELGAAMLKVTPEVEALARHYMAARIIPARFQDDL
jgi:hypothetical protein